MALEQEIVPKKIGPFTKAALWFERWQAGYIRPAQPYDPEKIARRNRTLLRSGLALASAGTLALGTVLAYPSVSDYLDRASDFSRSIGDIDPTTPVKLPPNPPKDATIVNSSGRYVELSTPYDVALGGKSLIINDTPGLKVEADIELMEQITANQKYGLNLGENQRVISLIVASESSQFFISEQRRIYAATNLNFPPEPDGRFFTMSADDEIQKLISQGYAYNIDKNTPFLSFLYRGGGTLIQHLSYAFSSRWLEHIKKVALNATPQSFNPSSDLLGGKSVINVTEIDKAVFDRRQRKGNKPLPFTPTPFAATNTNIFNSPTPEPSPYDDPTIKCVITTDVFEPKPAPALVQFGIGFDENSSNSTRRSIIAAQFDYDNDGRWDSEMSYNQTRGQVHTYDKVGQNIITGRVRLSDGAETRPCQTGFILK